MSAQNVDIECGVSSIDSERIVLLVAQFSVQVMVVQVQGRTTG
jgi:hypothetical protein